MNKKYLLIISIFVAIFTAEESIGAAAAESSVAAKTDKWIQLYYSNLPANYPCPGNIRKRHVLHKIFSALWKNIDTTNPALKPKSNQDPVHDHINDIFRSLKDGCDKYTLKQMIVKTPTLATPSQKLNQKLIFFTEHAFDFSEALVNYFHNKPKSKFALDGEDFLLQFMCQLEAGDFV